MPDRATRGFTLLEVLIALVIVSLTLWVLFSGAVTGLRATTIGQHYEEAVSRARSHLAVVGHGAPLAAGEQTGDDGSGFRWRLRIVPIGSAPTFAPAGGEAHPPRIVLYDVVVAISWEMDGAPRTVSLESQRVGN